MQHCENCHTQFKRKKIYRYLWGPIFNPLCCPSCGQEHCMTLKGRFTNSIVLILPMILFTQLLTPFYNIALNLMIGLLLLLAGSLLNPFLVRFKLVYND
ncbi:hypothetical protein KYJ26_07440 [Bacillus sp. MCCB 382]|uniref:TIGR04104 family putative zinc finger protein n=1 Tax=Bacillus sp. MCCB 382 TaxID=2860197 RepID=UPI001C568B02|nr:hypothetical protein [Bacillus sp. MCCB 382]